MHLDTCVNEHGYDLGQICARVYYATEVARPFQALLLGMLTGGGSALVVLIAVVGLAFPRRKEEVFPYITMSSAHAQEALSAAELSLDGNRSLLWPQA